MRKYLLIFAVLTLITSFCFPQAKGKKPSSDNGNNKKVKENIVIDERELKSDLNTLLLFHFNESNGTVIFDASGNSNNGYTTGTTVTKGKYGYARYFNGRNDYITVKNNHSISNLSSITIEVWIKPMNFDLSCWANAEDILTKGRDSQRGRPDGFGLRIERNSNSDCGAVKSFDQFKIDFDFGGTGCGTKWFEPNQWYYVVATYDGSYCKIYINGALEVTSEYAPNLIATTKDNVFINHHEWEGGQTSQRMAGIIDELRISNIARTDYDITNYYNSVTDVKEKNISENIIKFNKSIYFNSIDKTCYVDNFYNDMQEESSSYAGKYTWIMNLADEENNGSWEDIFIKYSNGIFSGYSIFYPEAVPDPSQNFSEIIISKNVYRLKYLNSTESKHGRFVYTDVKDKNGSIIRIRGLLIEDKIDGNSFYEKEIHY